MSNSGQKYKSYAKRSLGQNFLVDEKYSRAIVAALGDITEDLVIEVGPGRGALTEHLIESVKSLVAIELDTALSLQLSTAYADEARVRIVESDILDADLKEIAGDVSQFASVKIVANLPYNISTPVLQRLAIFSDLFSQAVLMLQKEVVERITAKPGSSDRGFLTVCTEAFFKSEKLFDVPPGAFRPVPKVMSSVVRLIPNRKHGIIDEDIFRRLVSAGFLQKRKTIFNNLKSVPFIKDAKELLAEANIDSRLRPEALEFDEWKAIANHLSAGSMNTGPDKPN